MRIHKYTGIALLIAATLGFLLHPANAAKFKAAPKKANGHSKLTIRKDAVTGKVIVSWKGWGVLKKAGRMSDDFKKVYQGAGDYVIDPTEEVAMFKLDNRSDNRNGPLGPGPLDQTNVYSLNVVGYVNVRLMPGLTLIANPLYQPDSTLGAILGTNSWTVLPGCQVFKFTEGSVYEVSTFDGVSTAWSNPGLDINIGTGFFFNNPSSVALNQTFVGEVLQGVLVNPLPAGLSTKGALVPQESSINDTNANAIPGMTGDEIRMYVNDGQGGGYYNQSVYNANTHRWEPDLILHVAEGFWINKQQPQDWVRVFYVP